MKKASFSTAPFCSSPSSQVHLPTHSFSSTPEGTCDSLLMPFTAWSFANLSEASSIIAQQTQVSWVQYTAFKS